jgi:hypothetical protein
MDELGPIHHLADQVSPDPTRTKVIELPRPNPIRIDLRSEIKERHHQILALAFDFEHDLPIGISSVRVPDDVLTCLVHGHHDVCGAFLAAATGRHTLANLVADPT